MDFTKYRFIFKENALRSIMTAKGWDSYADVARATGYTRQYISLIDSQKGEVTHQFMISLAIALGSVNDGWWSPFRIVPTHGFDIDHQRYNYEKYNGRVPYRPHSPSGQMRSKDMEIEIRGN